jgi:hypothetical protein
MERNQIRSSLAECQTTVSALLHSFDPLCATTAASTGREPLQNGDLLQVAALLSRACLGLRNRLLGDAAVTAGGGRLPSSTAPPFPQFHPMDSPAERDLKNLLKKPPELESRVPEQASDALSKGARPLLLKLGDQAQSPRSAAGRSGEFSNCSHCHGSVHVV